MPGFRDVLGWLRFAGPPGPAAPAAVPADRRSRLLAEAGPIFAALAPVVQQASDLVAEAAAEADQIRADALREQQQIVREAEEARPALYATAFAGRRAAAAARGQELVTQARRQAERIAQRAAVRCPALADEAAQRVCESLRPAHRPGTP